MQAIISDIHGNLEALEAVLADIKQHGVTEVVCLGDIVGYGPNPKQCLDVARDFDVVIQGNHEQALLIQMQSSSFNVRAKNSIDWTRDQFSMLSEEREENSRRWDFLGSLEETYTRNGMLYVHGSPREPVSEYLYPRDIYRPEKLKELFDMIEWVCFVGHTHVPGIWTEDMIYLTPEEVNYRYRIGRKKTIINVGSVGQPRDGDPRACYVLFEKDTALFRKLNYSILSTIEKIQGIPELDPFLADRLREGR